MSTVTNKILYLDLFPPDVQWIFRQYQGDLINYLKETTIAYYESNRIDLLSKLVCPILPTYTFFLLFFSVLTVYGLKGELRLQFIELFAKCLFQPNREILPSEMSSIIECLLGLLKGKIKGNLIFNWEPCFQVLETFFRKKTRGAQHISIREEAAIRSQLSKVINKLKPFFPPESGAQIYDYIRSFICPKQARDPCYLYYLHCLLRTDSNILPEHYTFWLHELINLWESNTQDNPFNATLLFLVSSLARYAIYYFYKFY